MGLNSTGMSVALFRPGKRHGHAGAADRRAGDRLGARPVGAASAGHQGTVLLAAARTRLRRILLRQQDRRFAGGGRPVQVADGIVPAALVGDGGRT